MGQGGGSSPDRSRRIIAVARTLGVNATTGEVVAALQGAGCRSLVIKGPAFQRELYGDGATRNYSDTDLLVSESELQRAASVLDAIGFELVIDHSEHEGIEEPHAQEWRRPGGRESVDLHWRIPGMAADARRTWTVLAARTEALVVSGTTCETLDRPGTALLVALHAAHHGRTRDRPLADLERALEQMDAGTWTAAARLAEELDATEALAAGLSLAPVGSDLAAALGLPPVRSPTRRLMTTTQRPGSLGVLRILDASGARERLRAARVFLFPGPAFMRAVSPLARRGRLGLALSYCGRIAARTWQLPQAIRAVRAARPPPGATAPPGARTPPPRSLGSWPQAPGWPGRPGGASWS
jgi:hypothetical protein